MFIRYDVIHERVRRTDGRTLHDSKDRAYASHRAVKSVRTPLPSLPALPFHPPPSFPSLSSHLPLVPFLFPLNYLTLKNIVTLKSTLSPVHTLHGDKVDRIGNKVDRDKLSNSSCCRFVADLSPVSATVDFVTSEYRA